MMEVRLPYASLAKINGRYTIKVEFFNNSICLEVSMNSAGSAYNLFNEMGKRNFKGGLHIFNNPSVGMKCFIAIHNRRPSEYGAALGGVRMDVYENHQQAEYDVIRLAEGMTLKNLLAGLPVGGGKAVIWLDEAIRGEKEKTKKEKILMEFANCVNELDGKYITAPDAGTNVSDMLVIKKYTEFVVGLVDPSPLTAIGVLAGMKVGASHLWGSESLKGKKVLIQGAGKTGSVLAKLLAEEGAHLIISDISVDTMMSVCKSYDAVHCDPDDIYSMDADIFAPCAHGAIINNKTIHHVGEHFKMICGAANNQLEFGKAHGRQLKNADVLYLPDFAVNCGGVIVSHYELLNGHQLAEEHINDIERRVEKQVKCCVSAILEKSREEKTLATNEIAEKMALDILAAEEANAI